MLFKRDRPRPIDRYIDYFGDAEPRPGPQAAAERAPGTTLERSS